LSTGSGIATVVPQSPAMGQDTTFTRRAYGGGCNNEKKLVGIKLWYFFQVTFELRRSLRL